VKSKAKNPLGKSPEVKMVSLKKYRAILEQSENPAQRVEALCCKLEIFPLPVRKFDARGVLLAKKSGGTQSPRPSPKSKLLRYQDKESEIPFDFSNIKEKESRIDPNLLALIKSSNKNIAPRDIWTEQMVEDQLETLLLAENSMQRVEALTELAKEYNVGFDKKARKKVREAGKRQTEGGADIVACFARADASGQGASAGASGATMGVNAETEALKSIDLEDAPMNMNTKKTQEPPRLQETMPREEEEQYSDMEEAAEVDNGDDFVANILTRARKDRGRQGSGSDDDL
jgi:hypothetical protein